MYLVVWYGDIPKETFFVATRVNYAPWGKLGWAALCLIWVVPFFLLLGRQAKRRSAILAAACLSGLVGFWLERYVLISPSLTPWHVPFGWIEILVTLGFGGIFGLASFSGIRKINEEVSRDKEQRTPSRAA
jgi:Ni/Fe-hydrogenase subunit HybB-like protein